jgi:hypothetical protein
VLAKLRKIKGERAETSIFPEDFIEISRDCVMNPLTLQLFVKQSPGFASEEGG